MHHVVPRDDHGKQIISLFFCAVIQRDGVAKYTKPRVTGVSSFAKLGKPETILPKHFVGRRRETPASLGSTSGDRSRSTRFLKRQPQAIAVIVDKAVTDALRLLSLKVHALKVSARILLTPSFKYRPSNFEGLLSQKKVGVSRSSKVADDPFRSPQHFSNAALEHLRLPFSSAGTPTCGLRAALPLSLISSRGALRGVVGRSS